MKPKTDTQKRVVELSSKLPPINKKQIQWGKSLFDKYMYERKHDVSCFECGHRFVLKRGTTCPNCHKQLQTWTESKRSGKDYWYMSVFTTIKEFQVLRYWRVNKYMKVDKPAEYVFKEVYQHWISSKGTHILMSRLLGPFSNWRFDPWSSSDMEIRNYASDVHLIKDVPMYPYRRILPELIRNGFYGDYYKFHPSRLFTLLLKSPIAETFVKTNNITMLEIYAKNEKEFNKYWPSYKICIRHKFKVPDWSTWFDHMKLLDYFHYDLRNPKYICSSTFMFDHQKLVIKKRKIEDRKAQERHRLYKIEQEKRDKEQLEKAIKNLEKYKQKYFNMKFIDSDAKINIVVLNSIEDFKLEQEALLHCVYDSKYYEKIDSLILSARCNEKRLETIEFDLNNMRIIQCRGKDNKSTRYHKKILNLVNNNIDIIKQIKETA